MSVPFTCKLGSNASSAVPTTSTPSRRGEQETPRIQTEDRGAPFVCSINSFYLFCAAFGHCVQLLKAEYITERKIKTWLTHAQYLPFKIHLIFLSRPLFNIPLRWDEKHSRSFDVVTFVASMVRRATKEKQVSTAACSMARRNRVTAKAALL